MKKLCTLLALCLAVLVGTARAEFAVNDVAGFNVSSGGLPPSYVYNGEFESGSGTTLTYTNAPIGTADPTRLVVATSSCRGAGTTSLSSSSIGGNAAGTVVETASTNDDSHIVQLAVPTGTTATVSFTYSSSQNQCHICVYSLYNLASQTATPTANQNTTTAAVTFAGAVGDIVISNTTSRAVSSIGWTGVAENANYFPGSGMSCASELLSGSISAVTPDFNGTPAQHTSVAGWR